MACAVSAPWSSALPFAAAGKAAYSRLYEEALLVVSLSLFVG